MISCHIIRKVFAERTQSQPAIIRQVDPVREKSVHQGKAVCWQFTHTHVILTLYIDQFDRASYLSFSEGEREDIASWDNARNIFTAGKFSPDLIALNLRL